ncbi:PA3715 family protein [Luteimonas sp. A501]
MRTSDAFGEPFASEYLMNIVAEACKAWPYDPGRLLVAAAYSTDESFSGNRELQIRVAVLDAQDLRFLAGHAWKESEDAGFELLDHALTLDTARYDLAPGVRAFGVIVENAAPGPSCPDYRYDRELRLFVVDGGRLRPVLRQHLDAWMRVEGEPCSPSMGPVVTDQADIMLAMGEQLHAGYRDIRLSARISRASSGSDATALRTERGMLRYDGRQYRLLGEDDAFWSGPPGLREWRDIP